jgi:hypothetical protein
MVQRTLQKKKVNQAVHVDVDEASEEEDTDGEDDDGDKKMLKKTGSGLNSLSAKSVWREKHS